MIVFSAVTELDRLVAFVPEQQIPETIPSSFLITAIVVISVIGIILGAILAFAAKRFAVRENPLIEEVEEILPKGQCGACGFPGCKGYAEAVVQNQEVAANLCAPGGENVARLVAEITGKKGGDAKKVKARLRCVSDAAKGAAVKFSYTGITDCVACNLLQKGSLECPYGCLGLGTCRSACPFGAIKMAEDRPQFDENLCTGCGVCVKSCPRACIELAAFDALVHCHCSNREKGAQTKKLCPGACIGCGLCAKNCPHGIITMENNLPVVQHEKCPRDCPIPCVQKCPTGAIKPLSKADMTVTTPSAAN